MAQFKRVILLLFYIFLLLVSGGKSVETEILKEKDSQRKKEGIFYTPEYITSYIVKEAVGGWLEDRKKERAYPF